MKEVFIIIDYVGTFVFAVTGASIAVKSKFDFFGMLFLAFLTAVGGGTVRDLIISQKVFWTVNPTYLYLIFIAALMTFFLSKKFEKTAALMLFLDTLGVGAFAVIGTHKSLIHGLNGETAFLMGVVTAVLGGILRSAFSREQSILIKRELYASVAAISSFTFIMLRKFDVDAYISGYIVILVTIIIRYASIKFKILMPSVKD
ncbi:trimeric intracellular cation channel family protein [Flavobacterium alkalisoli]|uniref:trimeric intracellular cation channel family protein n=1 Tax=Flavobacterium alkalisoli TaxID=2602769 RepID=UPI003A94307D